MSRRPRRKGEAEPRSRRTGRRSPPPPGILLGPHEALEGSLVLEEWPGPVAVLLWQSLRDVTLWAATPATSRQGLFQPGAMAVRLARLVEAGVEPALQAPLATLAALVGDPASAREEPVSRACLQVARWAEGRGAAGTALAFAQGAALASPADAAAALETGRLARERGESARAESWLRRAIGLGRRGDRHSLCLACLELGATYAGRGDADTARLFLLRALRGGRRRHFHGVVGRALLALFRLETARGRAEEADAYARAAMQLAPGEPLLAAAVREVAARRLSEDRFEEAAAALRLLLPHTPEPAERLGLLGGLASAAGGAGDEAGFEHAARDAWRLLGDTGHAERLPALLDLARGAVQLRRWESAERAAQLALEAAAEVGDSASAARAEEVLAAVWREAGRMHRVRGG